MIFGTPPLVRELCVRVSGTPPTLPRGSLVVTGGGWKGGQSLQLDALLELVTSRLGVPASHIVDTYGTTELNAYLCAAPTGRITSHRSCARWSSTTSSSRWRETT